MSIVGTANLTKRGIKKEKQPYIYILGRWYQEREEAYQILKWVRKNNTVSTKNKNKDHRGIQSGISLIKMWVRNKNV